MQKDQILHVESKLSMKYPVQNEKFMEDLFSAKLNVNLVLWKMKKTSI